MEIPIAGLVCPGTRGHKLRRALTGGPAPFEKVHQGFWKVLRGLVCGYSLAATAPAFRAGGRANGSLEL